MRNTMKKKRLVKIDPFAMLAGKATAQADREARALASRRALEAEFRKATGVPAGEPIGEAYAALLAVASSALVEIERTTTQMLAGRARAKAMANLAAARSELRRCLRALGLIGTDGEGTNGDSAPPPGATEEQKREWSRKYVENRLAEGRAAQ